MTTTEKNKLIAEFMGLSYCTKHMYEGWYKNNEHNHRICDFNALKYNFSWDWLMPVVKKIHELGYVCVFYGNYCFIQDIPSFKNKPSSEIKEFFIQQYCKQDEELIVSVFETVAWFVEWYNENLKK